MSTKSHEATEPRRVRGRAPGGHGEPPRSIYGSAGRDRPPASPSKAAPLARRAPRS